MPHLFETNDGYFLLKFSKKESKFIKSSPKFKEILLEKNQYLFEDSQDSNIQNQQNFSELIKKINKISKNLSALSELNIHSFRQLTYSNLEDHYASELLKRKLEKRTPLSEKEQKLAKFLAEKYSRYSKLIHRIFETSESKELINILDSLDSGSK